MPAAGWKRWVIDYDQPCPHCAYSLRGLRPKDRCPECGKEIPDYSVTEERHLLHRADRQFLERLRLGSAALEWLPPFHVATTATAAVSGSVSIGLALVGASIAGWFGAWTLITSHDPTLPRTAPFNSSARLCRTMGIVVFLLGVLLFASWTLVHMWHGVDQVAIAFTLAVAWLCLAALHAVMCISHKDAILWRAQRLLTRPQTLPSLIWILATLAGLVLHLYIFTRADRLRRAATLALNAEPTP